MSDFYEIVSKSEGVILNAPAQQSVITKLEEIYGVSFPENLIRLWRFADGIAFEQQNAHILGPTELLGFLQNSNMHEWTDVLLKKRMVPLLDDHQSNYVNLITKAPLALRVTSFPHDGDARLLYSSLERFLVAIVELMDSDDTADGFFRSDDGDYGCATPRTEADCEAAKELLKTNGKDYEWNYAIQLLDASNVAEWKLLLETDHFVRRDALARLKQMREPSIRAILKADSTAYEQFALELASAARDAGLQVGERQSDCLKINGNWMMLDFAYHRRGIPNAFQRFINWANDVSLGVDPCQRSDHFLVD
jgi:hypothetical protein